MGERSACKTAEDCFAGRGRMPDVQSSLVDGIHAMKIQATAATGKNRVQREMEGVEEAHCATVRTHESAKGKLAALTKCVRRIQSTVGGLATRIENLQLATFRLCDSWEAELELQLTEVLTAKERMANELYVWFNENEVGKAKNFSAMAEKDLEEKQLRLEMLEHVVH